MFQRIRLKRAGLLTKLVVVGLLICLGTSLMDLRGKIRSAETQQDSLQVQVEEQRLENQKLEESIANSDDPDVLERVARERGYVKQGETLYIDIAG